MAYTVYAGTAGNDLLDASAEGARDIAAFRGNGGQDTLIGGAGGTLSLDSADSHSGTIGSDGGSYDGTVTGVAATAIQLAKVFALEGATLQSNLADGQFHVATTVYGQEDQVGYQSLTLHHTSPAAFA